MEWYHALSILLPIAIMHWVMHRENSKEMKDFHGRLCQLEERYIQLMQRIWEKGNN